MAQLFKGRYTARMEGDFVVFLIGMRINQLWAVHKWLPVLLAMPRMQMELARNRQLGMLHLVNYFGRTTLSMQYWRSAELLHAYAHAKDAAHLPAWAAFNRRTKDNSAVAVYHETYLVQAGGYECVYVNAPRMGLAMAGELVPAVGRMQSMRTRLGQEDDDAPVS